MVKLPLMPGVLVGNVNPYIVKRGDTLAWIAARFGVHPLHVTKPSAKELRHGMSRGDKIWIDQRRVQPAFKADVSGVVLNLPEAEVYLVDKGTLSNYRYLEHGAFWAIGALAAIMLGGVAYHIPEAITGGIGLALIGIAFWSSKRANARENAA